MKPKGMTWTGLFHMVRVEFEKYNKLFKNSQKNFLEQNPDLPSTKVVLKPSGKLPYLAELKDLMSNGKSFQNYLKPLSEEELNKIVLNDEELEKKQELVYERQIQGKKSPVKKAHIKKLKEPQIKSSKKYKVLIKRMQGKKKR